MILTIAIVAFIVLETGNVLILYFAPDSRLGNGVAVFNSWFAAQENEPMGLFAKYLVNWVAGTKSIFIALLIAILATAGDTTKIAAVFAMIASIATYYVGLHPIIKKLDEMGEITPAGYSKTLLGMITGFQIMFVIAAIAGIVTL